MNDLIIYSLENRIATVTLNRPEKSNALNPDLIGAIIKALEKASTDEKVKIIIIKSSGKSFSAGADLAYLQSLQTNSFEENLADSNVIKNLFSTIYYLNKIVIAQVEGYAIAGGCGLATVCDFVFATPNSRFGYTEVKIGFVPAIVSTFLVTKIGPTAAKELLFTGNIISAEEALNYKLINFVTNPEDITQKVNAFALHLCNKCSSASLSATKKLINKNIDEDFKVAVEFNAQARETDDFKLGIKSFLDKTEINW